MNARRPSALRLDLEILEDRLLPAGGISASLSHGVLAITDAKANTGVVVREINDRFSVFGVKTTFAASKVSIIGIATPKGRDNITITDSSWPGQQDIRVPVKINTGTGRDSFYGLNNLDSIRDPKLTGGKSMHYTSEQLWQEMGGAAGPLGKPVGDEKAAGDGVGSITMFQGGAIYWSADSGAHETHGLIYQKWAQMGGIGSFGVPTTNEQDSADGLGRISYFQWGAIYWTSDSGAHETHGAIYQKWLDMGGENSPQGEPVTDEQNSADGLGRISYFQGGAIYWTADSGAHETHGAIYGTWLDNGGETGPLGKPVSDEQDAGDGVSRISYFQNGNIYWSPATGTQVSINGFDPWADLDNFVGTLANSTLAADVRAWTTDDGQLSRADVLNLLAAEESFGSVSGSDISDLQAIAANYQVENMPYFVSDLLRKVVGDNAANANYQGNALGDIYDGSSSDQLSALADKWFYGGDLPAADSSTTYDFAQGSLYGDSGVPQYTDIVQGWDGDCYFLASLATIAQHNPEVLQNGIIDNGDGTFTIAFNQAGFGQTPSWDYVTVNRMMPAYYQTDGNGNIVSNPLFAYANCGQDTTNGANVLWVTLYEKAYVQLAEEGWSRWQGAANAYSSINDGNLALATLQVTGRSITEETIADNLDDAFQQLTNGPANGQWLTMCTPGDEQDPNIVGGHCYAVAGYDPNTQLFTLYNPWGFSQQISWNDLQNDFTWIDYST